jgi:hypothetical protein
MTLICDLVETWANDAQLSPFHGKVVLGRDGLDELVNDVLVWYPSKGADALEGDS